MSYRSILNEIKPSNTEKKKVHKIANDAIDFINEKCKKENINAKAILVGSVAKDTWLSGKADIDIFINFSLDKDEDYLKEKGLYLGYECSAFFDGVAEEHYASHPYVTSNINGYYVDFVPCYNISDAEELKSAVDRTLLHTKYIQKHLHDDQKDEVLLLKKFMLEVGTYGSEFKVGGFAGYLCEILILKYGSFEETLNAASNWKNKTVINLENYESFNLFKDPLIAIDPIDKNRNVAASLRLEKMIEFIIASRNFLKNKKIQFFQPITKKIQLDDIISQFEDRKTRTIALKFNIPDIPIDTLHPQLRKTEKSIVEKLEFNDFNTFKSGYWTDENKIAIILLELNVFKQNKYKIHEGPKVWDKKACDNFINSHVGNYYVIEDILVFNKKREFETAEMFLKHVLTKEYSHIIKIGKNLSDSLLDSYELTTITNLLVNEKLNSYFNESNEFLEFLDDFLNPGQLLNR